MALAKKRMKNVKKTGVKLAKVKALKFKKAASKVPTINMENVRDCPEIMEIDSEITKKLTTKKLTKKQLIRKMRKDDLRKCLEEKRQKYKQVAPDAMEGAPPVEEEPSVVQQKTNSKRIQKDSLPIMPLSKENQRKVREKELVKSSVVTGRRMSKKKARKILNALERDKREKERKQAAMELA